MNFCSQKLNLNYFKTWFDENANEHLITNRERITINAGQTNLSLGSNVEEWNVLLNFEDNYPVFSTNNKNILSC